MHGIDCEQTRSHDDDDDDDDESQTQLQASKLPNKQASKHLAHAIGMMD